MSRTATARATTPRTAPARKTAARPPLRVVPPPRWRAPRAPFVLLSLGVVAAGLLSLLALRTIVVGDAFRVHELEVRSAQLREQEQRLRREVAALEAPTELAARAAALGMQPASAPVFLRIADGKVMGTAIPAPQRAATQEQKSQPPAPAAKPSPRPAPSGSAQPQQPTSP